MHKTKSGFTIVELLIVIVVIGILAAITIVAYNGIQNRARASSASIALSQAAKKLALYVVDNPNTYPPDLATVGVTNSSDVSYRYSYNNAITPATFCIMATSGAISYNITQATSPQSGGCVVTNLATNPRALSSGSGWYSDNNTSIPVTKGNVVTGNPDGITTAIRTQLAAGQSNPIIMSIYSADNLGNSATVRSVATWVYASAAGYRTCVGAGSCVYTDLAANTWTYLKSTSLGSGYARITIRTISGASAGANDYAYATGFIATTDATAPNFADGDSTNWVWNGTAGASASTGPAY